MADAFQGKIFHHPIVPLKRLHFLSYRHYHHQTRSHPLCKFFTFPSAAISPTSITTTTSPQLQPRLGRPRCEQRHVSHFQPRKPMSSSIFLSKEDDNAEDEPVINTDDVNARGSDGGNNSQEGDDPSKPNNRRSKSWSTARIGGRNKQRNISKSKASMPPSESKPNSRLAGILAIIFLAVALTFGRGSFGNRDGDSGYYYYSYSSSVYETRTYNDSGQLEDTSRKEQREERSNLPGFKASKSSDRQQQQDQIIMMNEEALMQQEKRFDEFVDSIVQDSMPFRIDQYMEE